MLSFGDGSQLNNCRPCLCIVLSMWLPGSSPFIPENKGTTLLSLRCLPPRCTLPVREAVLLQGEGTSSGLAFRKLPWGNGAGLHSPAAHTLGEVSLCVETCSYLSSRKPQQEAGKWREPPPEYRFPHPTPLHLWPKDGPVPTQQWDRKDSSSSTLYQKSFLWTLLLHAYILQRISFMPVHCFNNN